MDLNLLQFNIQILVYTSIIIGLALGQILYADFKYTFNNTMVKH